MSAPYVTQEEWNAAASQEERGALIGRGVQRAVAELQPRVEAVVADLQTETAVLEQRSNELLFEKLVHEQASLAGSHRGAGKFFVTSVKEAFALRDGVLRPTNGQTLPGDPLVPLTIEAWFAQRKTEADFAYLFEGYTDPPRTAS